MTAIFPPVIAGDETARVFREQERDLQGARAVPRRKPWPLALAACLLLSLLVAVTLLAGPAARQKASHRQPAMSPSPLLASSSPPKVEPLIFDDMDAKTAQRRNAEIPFAPFGNDRPAAFQLTSGSAEFDRATDCLASALLYEAGDDPVGQRAVAQVVLNRVRHPAFPHSVCGVVYQGAERATGCQFTFTCDGALARGPTPAAWQRARTMAAAFLQGRTEPLVGMATHYHTDWVHPYWSGSLDKIARVGSHLFFRWKGGWGRRRAFTSAYSGLEALEPRLAALSAAHRDPALPDMAELSADAAPAATLGANATSADLLSRHEGDHFILVDAQDDGSKLALQGLGECTGQLYCKVVGWDRRSQGYGSPANPLIRSVAFLYVSDKRTGVEVVLWDCVRFNRPAQSQCLSDANRRWVSFQGNLSRAS